MPEPTMEDRRQAAGEGAFGHVAGLLAATAAYLRARLQLAGLEGVEAAIHLAVVVGLALASLVAVVFGYFFFCLGLIFTIAALIDTPHAWLWTTFIFALLHFGLAVGALLVARARLAAPMFKETLDQFRKDQEWLTQQKPI